MNRTEVVIHHDIAEVPMGNKNVLTWLGTQTYTIEYLDDEVAETPAIESNELSGEGSSIHSTKNSESMYPGNNVTNTIFHIKTENDDNYLKETYPTNTLRSLFSNEATSDTNSSQDSLYMHNNNYSNENNNYLDDIDSRTCKICQKILSTRAGKTMHERVHFKNSQPQFTTTTCPVCGRTFKRPYDLKRHLTVHTGERPYKCERCNRTFAQRNRHKYSCNREILETTTGITCEICNRRFKDQECLEIHYKEHANNAFQHDLLDAYSSNDRNDHPLHNENGACDETILENFFDYS